MGTPRRNEIVSLMTDKSLLETGIDENNARQDFLSEEASQNCIYKDRGNCVNTDGLNMIKTESNEASDLFENIVPMDTEDISTVTIKTESEVEDFESQNISLDIIKCDEPKPKSNLLLLLESQAAMENVVLDHFFCSTVFNQPDNNPTPFSEQNEARLKCEATNVYEDWIIKREEVEIKEEDPEQKPTRSRNDEIDELVTVKIDEGTSASDYIPDIENRTIKPEELDLKEEDLQVGETGISPHTSRHRPEKNHEHETATGSSEKYLLRPMDPEEDEKEYKCSQCEYQSDYITTLKRHMRVHMNPEELQTYKCSRCEFKTIHKTSLKRHLYMHLPPEKVKKFKCKQCGYQTLYKPGLKTHLLTHLPDNAKKKFKCNQCEFEALDIRYLRRHLSKHMNPEEVDKFKCHHCEFDTLDKDSLKKHLRRHMNPEDGDKLKCTQCDYEVVQKRSLKQHLLKHTNPEEAYKFKCSQCEFQAVENRYLKQHLLKHKTPEQVEKLKCSLCKFDTLHKGSLKRHLLSHELKLLKQKSS